jgi:Asp-tRNA(Asn)/Glu-tRNA(Gln) amidotransferase B subunit
MDFSTILASIRRSPLGALLIMVQVAITLAILLNAAGIVQQHAARMASVSGVDEPNVFTLLNRWIVRARGLTQIRDESQLEGWVGSVIDEHPSEVARFRGGEAKLVGFFVGQVMKRSGGKADPKRVSELLRAALG